MLDEIDPFLGDTDAGCMVWMGGGLSPYVGYNHVLQLFDLKHSPANLAPAPRRPAAHWDGKKQNAFCVESKLHMFNRTT